VTVGYDGSGGGTFLWNQSSLTRHDYHYAYEILGINLLTGLPQGFFPVGVGVGKTRQEVVNDAVWNAAEAIRKYPGCRELLANPMTISGPDLANYLGKLSAAGKIHPGNVPSGGAAEWVAGKSEINVSPKFFASTFPVFGEGTPRLPSLLESPTIRQTLIILHELGHATDAPTHGSKNADSEGRYNQLIYEKCIKGR
jgi:hypothetical protein